MGDLIIPQWQAVFGVDYYLVEVEHRTTQEKDSETTTAITVTFYNKPSGTYDYKVTAVMPDETTNIIVEDVLVL